MYCSRPIPSSPQNTQDTCRVSTNVSFTLKNFKKHFRFVMTFLKFKLQSVFVSYLCQFRSNFHIQRHFRKLEIKSFHLAPRIMGFYSLLMEILAPKGYFPPTGESFLLNVLKLRFLQIFPRFDFTANAWDSIHTRTTIFR